MVGTRLVRVILSVSNPARVSRGSKRRKHHVAAADPGDGEAGPGVGQVEHRCHVGPAVSVGQLQLRHGGQRVDRDVPVGEDHSLGVARGAAGVVELGDVGLGDRTGGEGRGGERLEGVLGQAEVGRRDVSAGPKEAAHLAGLREDGSGQPRHGGIGDEPGGAAVAQDEAEFGGAEAEVEGDQHGAQSRRREVGLEIGEAVGEQRGDPVPGSHSLGQEEARQPVHPGSECCVVEAEGTVHDCFGPGMEETGPEQETPEIHVDRGVAAISRSLTSPPGRPCGTVGTRSSWAGHRRTAARRNEGRRRRCCR